METLRIELKLITCKVTVLPLNHAPFLLILSNWNNTKINDIIIKIFTPSRGGAASSGRLLLVLLLQKYPRKDLNLYGS